jgi:hypothetical protein
LVNSVCRAERNYSIALIRQHRSQYQSAPGLEVGNLAFQSIDFAAENFRIFDGVFRVGFKSVQELAQSNKVRIGRGFQHGPDRNRLARREKRFSTYK